MIETISADNSGTIVAGNMEVQAEQFIGRDNIVNYYENHSGFATINISAHTEEFYITPNFTETALHRINEQRLILIAGESDFDKHEFARHLAQRISNAHSRRDVKEWSDPEETGKILTKVKEFSESSIFILPNIAPKDINYDPASLAKVAKERGHFFLITTEMSSETWNLAEALKTFYWFEIPRSGLYSKDKLAAIFAKEVAAHRDIFGVQPEIDLTPELVLAGDYTLSSVAACFERPNEINFFVIQLAGDNSPGPLEQKIRTAIRNVTDKKESLVTKWFRTLDPHQKLIVLGAALLDGLFDDQYFAVTQKIVEDFWHHRSQQMRSLDYCDLDFLLNFFKFGALDDGRLILESKFPNQRAEIIRAAWAGHKRHILSAFAIITRLAGSSAAAAANRVTDPEINGTIERGKRLRAVTAETISDIGIVSVQTAEPKLLSLASASDETTRRITAKAVARWRAFSKEDQMFRVLESWSKKSNSTIRSSVIFTLQYAAEYDSPGALEPRIMQLLNNMAGDDGITGSMNTILPRLMGYHLEQIKNDLFEYFAIHEQYSDTLARTLTHIYSDQPHIVKLLLEDWLGPCLDVSSSYNRRDKPTFRDNVVQLILKVYRSIPYRDEEDAIPISYVWNILNNLHSNEQRKSMRYFVLQTAAFLINTQPEQAVRYIEPLFAKIGLQDRLGLIQSIGSLYLRQRAELAGGEIVITKENLQYPAWTTHQRPATGIESILTNWLQGNYAFAREVATLAFIEFARVLDYDEPRLIQDALSIASAMHQENIRQEQQRQYMHDAEQAVIYPVMPELSLWTRIKIFFLLLFRDSNEKIVLRELMRTLLMYKQTNPAMLQTLINRWNRSRNPKLERMAWWVGKLMRF